MRCVILDDYQQVATSYADWSVLPDLEVTAVDRHLGPDELAATLAGAEIAVAMRERTPFPAELLDRLPDLRLLVTTGMRNASIDVDAARARGVTVCGTSGASTPTVELTWALILGLLRHLPEETAGFRTGRWQSTVGVDLHGHTFGLLGLGRIGSGVAAVGRAFGMEVVAWSPHLTEERAAAAGARLVGKSELMATSDVLSIHMVLAASTRGIVGREDLGLMRPTAYLVNTSRAGLVDTAALVETLETGRIAGAAIDVYDVEPLPEDDVLRRLPTVLGTPHLGYVTADNYRRYFSDAVEDIAAWLSGEPVRVLG